jgi:hypothetical protein
MKQEKNMQALEYYFNPQLRKDTQFRVFEFKPEKKNLNHLGYLYLIVEFANFLKKDRKFLEELAEIIKREFYSKTKRLPEQALKEALKKANYFLYKKTEAGDVRWVGNLNVAVLNFANYFLYFSRGGNIQILLLRGDELSDIAQDLEEKIDPSPFKFFQGIASGKLVANDKIMVITQKLFENFYDKILPELINLPEIKDRTLKKFFRSKKREMKNWSGVFFLLLMEEKPPFFRWRLSFSLPKINKTLLLVLSLLFLLLVSYFIFR